MTLIPTRNGIPLILGGKIIGLPGTQGQSSSGSVVSSGGSVVSSGGSASSGTTSAGSGGTVISGGTSSSTTTPSTGGSPSGISGLALTLATIVTTLSAQCTPLGNIAIADTFTNSTYTFALQGTGAQYCWVNGDGRIYTALTSTPAGNMTVQPVVTSSTGQVFTGPIVPLVVQPLASQTVYTTIVHIGPGQTYPHLGDFFKTNPSKAAGGGYMQNEAAYPGRTWVGIHASDDLTWFLNDSDSGHGIYLGSNIDLVGICDSPSGRRPYISYDLQEGAQAMSGDLSEKGMIQKTHQFSGNLNFDVRIFNLELSGNYGGSPDPGNNQSAFRADATGATGYADGETYSLQGDFFIANCFWHHCDMGFLGGDYGSTLNIVCCQAENCGDGYGESHNVYIGPIARAYINNLRSYGSNAGHLVKSRAQKTLLTDSILATLGTTTSGYELDCPAGGQVVIRRNLIVKGVNSTAGFFASFLTEFGEGTNFDIPTYTITDYLVRDADGNLRSFIPGGWGSPGIQQMPAGAITYLDENGNTTTVVAQSASSLLYEDTAFVNLRPSSLTTLGLWYIEPPWGAPPAEMIRCSFYGLGTDSSLWVETGSVSGTRSGPVTIDPSCKILTTQPALPTYASHPPNSGPWVGHNDNSYSALFPAYTDSNGQNVEQPPLPVTEIGFAVLPLASGASGAGNVLGVLVPVQGMLTGVVEPIAGPFGFPFKYGQGVPNTTSSYTGPNYGPNNGANLPDTTTAENAYYSIDPWLGSIITKAAWTSSTPDQTITVWTRYPIQKPSVGTQAYMAHCYRQMKVSANGTVVQVGSATFVDLDTPSPTQVSSSSTASSGNAGSSGGSTSSSSTPSGSGGSSSPTSGGTALTSPAPLAFGVVGQPLAFGAAYTGTSPAGSAVSATVNGTAATVGAITASGGTYSVPVTMPSTGGRATVVLTIGGVAQPAVDAWVQPGAVDPYNRFISTLHPFETSKAAGRGSADQRQFYLDPGYTADSYGREIDSSGNIVNTPVSNYPKPIGTCYSGPMAGAFTPPAQSDLTSLPCQPQSGTVAPWDPLGWEQATPALGTYTICHITSDGWLTILGTCTVTAP